MRYSLISVSFFALAACGAAETTVPAADAQAPAAATATPAAEEAIAAPEMGPAGTYVLDPTHASLVWKVNHFGLSNYTARFTRLDATLEFNPDDASATSLTVTVDPSSVETDYPADFKATHADSPYDTFDEEIAQDPTFFNAGEYPEITFTSTEINPTGPATGTVTGDLTFLGVTRPVTLDVTYNGTATFPWAPDEPKIGFSATGTLKRSEFGLTKLVPNVGDEVELLIEAEFAKSDTE
ncbi:MAG: YceI family protein [Hyphomonas sp.]|nr:YceI family protein [Hyphomonas sp.]